MLFAAGFNMVFTLLQCLLQCLFTLGVRGPWMCVCVCVCMRMRVCVCLLPSVTRNTTACKETYECM